MAAALRHRGPDACGTWVGPGVGFAHTRLSLFDLSDVANQPWVEGGDALVFNGEIYNFGELRVELEAQGRRFRSTSDTEVLFALLQQRGLDETLRRIRGMFAFAFHDGASGITHLCRDRYGIKPLLYTERPEGVWFASEAKALLPVAGVEVDRMLTLFALRTLGDKFQTRTLFRDVRQVAPGSVVSVRAGRVVGDKAYAPLLDQVDEARYRELDRTRFDQVVDELRYLLERAVDRMAACDARLGVFLSGGVDSGLITAIAATQRHRDLLAFTSDVVGPGSEREAAQDLADGLGVGIETSVFGPGDWIRHWVATTWSLETPVITNPSAVPFGQVARVAHDIGYKAVLTGEASDELFLGYPRLASGGLERLAGAPVQALRRLYRRVPGLADAILDERDSNSSAFLRGIAGGFEDVAIESEAVDRYSFLPPEQARLHAVSAVMTQTSLQALLQRNDRMGMSASIESRFPFLDEDVVKFALNLPVRWKLRRSRAVHDPKHPFVVDKAPVRAIACSYLDEDRAARCKSGFATPGLHGVQIRPGAFRGGWAADAFGAGRSFDREIAEWHQPYDRAKLMSIEIFGRLFGAGHSVEAVEEFVRSTCVEV